MATDRDKYFLFHLCLEFYSITWGFFFFYDQNKLRLERGAYRIHFGTWNPKKDIWCYTWNLWHPLFSSSSCHATHCLND